MKKKTAILLSTCLLVLVGCDKNEDILRSDPFSGFSRLEGVEHGMIELGEKLNDPYTVDNMKAAARALYGTKGETALVTPTDIYMRFLPSSEEEFLLLQQSIPEMRDHPFDYRIVKDGDYYHDPSIPEGGFTWQYAVVKKDFPLPQGIRYEVLDECFIPSTGLTTRGEADGIDWNAVERESFRLTGNEWMLAQKPSVTKGEDVPTQPTGRIALVDSHYNDGYPVGLAGVKVVCNVFVKISTAYTDDEGYYSMKKSFSSEPRYSLVFANKNGFKIGFNLVLVPASVSTLGKGSAEGVSVLIDSDSDRHLFTRSVVNNAAVQYWAMCRESGISTPPADLRIWILQTLDVSSACMLHQGAIIDKGLVSDFLGKYSSLVKMFAPDITIGVYGIEEYYPIYSLVMHELAHASHFSQVGDDYWNQYIRFVITSYVKSGMTLYGNGTETGSGYCGVGEMWAYFIENLFHAKRYPGHLWNSGTTYWFHPQIFTLMNERGIPAQKIFKALQPSVTDVDALKAKLIELYPELQTDIETCFKRFTL